eukprot:SAG25_NODE_7540_length_474_cov_0.800000_1_plen_73_part_01
MFTLHRLIAGSLRRSNQARRRSSQPAAAISHCHAIMSSTVKSVSIKLLPLLPCSASQPAMADAMPAMIHDGES